ncbi:F-box and leucine-rich repeat protein 4 [Actinomortierella wolfii]|nr:F-box and leucine-rich repeat protein 4 [Actinomortierella wolfii]
MKPLSPTTVFGIPEILRMICLFLDTENLRQVAVVNRLCHQIATPILWHHLVVPEEWYEHDPTRLDRNGSLIRHMTLNLSPRARASTAFDPVKIESQLDQILVRTPHLKYLDLRLPAKMSSSILATTVAKRLPGLLRLDTDLLYWNEDDVRSLFISCTSLTHLSVHELTSKPLKAITDVIRQERSGAKQLERFKCVHGRFEPVELIDFVAHLPGLVELSVPVNQFLTSKDLIGIASHCTRLEVFSVNFCLGLSTTGFQAIIGANPRLQVLDLGMTEVADQDIALVAAHCPGLVSLSLPFCGNVTHESIKQIVRRCDKLEHLDISWCDRVMLSLFENDNEDEEKDCDGQQERQEGERSNSSSNGEGGHKSSEDASSPATGDAPVSQGYIPPRRQSSPRPFWVCQRLKYLDISGIHATYTEDAESSPTAASLLPAMYAQLAALRQLVTLNMSGLGFSLRLNPLACEAFEHDRLNHLEQLSLRPMKERLPWSDLVTVGNLFPRLRVFRFKSKDIVTEDLGSENQEVESKDSDVGVPLRDTIAKVQNTQSASAIATVPPTSDIGLKNITCNQARVIVARLRSGLEISVKARSSVDGNESDMDEEAFGGVPFGMGSSFGIHPNGNDGISGAEGASTDGNGPTWGFPAVLSDSR